MKCLAQFRRGRALGLPHPHTGLTPQHPKAKLNSLVNDIIRKSLSSAGKQIEGGKAAVDADGGREESVADSFSDITRENEWFLLEVTERVPCARSNHAAIASGGNVYVLGGESVDGLLSDVQVFTVERFAWKQLSSGASGAIQSTPSEKSGAQCPRLLAPFAGVWKGRLIVVGCEASAPNDSPVRVHSFEPIKRTWTSLIPKGDAPEARQGYRVVQVKSTLVVFGGQDASGRIVDDVVVLDLEQMNWTLLQTSGQKPAPRRYHAMACYGGQYIWIYGGKSYATYYNDIYCLDLKQLLWTKVKARGATPTMSRAGHVGLIRGDNFYIVGGENRGKEMVDTLAFDMRTRAWSVVTSVHAMSPLAHNGLSVLKVNHDGRQYLVAFGGHGILLSCQMYALLLPSVDQFSETNSLSSSESLRATPGTVSKRPTLPREKTSPSDPFEFHRASLSSLSWESNAALAAAASGPELAAEESPIPPLTDRPRGKTMSSYLNIDQSTLSGDPSRLSNASRHDLSELPHGIGQSEKDSISIEERSRSGTSDTELGEADGVRGLKVVESEDQSSLPSDPPIPDPIAEMNKMAERKHSRTVVKKKRGDTDAFSKQLRLAIKEMEEAQKSNQDKDEGLDVALMSAKELEEKIQKLWRNKEGEERKHKSNNTAKSKLGRRESRVPETELERDNRAANSCHEEITPNRTFANEDKRRVQATS